MPISPENPILAPSSLEGQTLMGTYVVEEKIASGGMAWVYRGRHKAFQSKWAIKILFPHHAENEDIRARFLRESHIQHQLAHPNIVRVHNIIEERNVCGCVMEWCDAGDLRRLIARYKGVVPASVAVPLFLSVLDGMAYAHARKTVHRDLKPENILLSQQDGLLLPRVSDFGIAKVLEDQGYTGTGSAIGTFSYMSPEQFLDAKNVDTRSDIYSLGVILYFMLTGRLPFPFKHTAEVNFITALHKVQHEAPPEPVEAPSVFVPIILRCLEKQPDDRYQSCEELRAALLLACEQEGVANVLPSAQPLLDLPKDLNSAEATPPPPPSTSLPVRNAPPRSDTPLPTPEGFLAGELGMEPETKDDLPQLSEPLAGPLEPLAGPLDLLAELPEASLSSPSQTPFAGGGKLFEDEKAEVPNKSKLVAIAACAGLVLLLGALWLLRSPSDDPPRPRPRPVADDGLSDPPPPVPSPRRPQSNPCPELKAQMLGNDWKRSLALYRALSPTQAARLCVLDAVALRFPEAIKTTTGRLLFQGAISSKQAKGARALHAALSRQHKAHLKKLADLRKGPWTQALQNRSFEVFQARLLALLSEAPAFPSTHRFTLEAQGQMSASPSDSLRLLVAYLKMLEGWKKDGFWAWMQHFYPRLFPQSSLQALRRKQARLQKQLRRTTPRPRNLRKRPSPQQLKREKLALEAADDAMRKKKWSKAAKLYREFIQKFPRSKKRKYAISKRKYCLVCASSPPWTCQ